MSCVNSKRELLVGAGIREPARKPGPLRCKRLRWGRAWSAACLVLIRPNGQYVVQIECPLDDREECPRRAALVCDDRGYVDVDLADSENWDACDVRFEANPASRLPMADPLRRSGDHIGV